jgi:hypothetical protein
MLISVTDLLVIAAVNQETGVEITDEKGVMNIGGLTRIGVRNENVAY